MNDILQIVANREGISVAQMQSKSREQEIVYARQKAMYLAKRFTNLSLKTIGKHFGGRDHSTVIHAIKCVEWNMDSDYRYKKTMGQLVGRLEALEAEKAKDNPRAEAQDTLSRAEISLWRF